MCEHHHSSTETKEHETFIAEIARLAIARLAPEEQQKCKARIVYGVGRPGVRGTTFYGAWKNGDPEPVDIIEVCALHEESLVQVAGTTIHEVGHVLAGSSAGHRKGWKEACARLGLRAAKAGGMTYHLAAFAYELREVIARHAFKDGKPIFGLNGTNVPTRKARPCTLGIGTKGGKSRGPGSGSRMRKFVCQCEPPIIVRSAREELRAQCLECGELFERS